MISTPKRAQGCRSIAFMLASLHSGSSVKVWPELVQESEKHACTLFIFPGGRLESHDEYEYMRNSIFSLIGGKEFDGILSWASSLSGFAPESEVAAFHRGRGSTPLVTFGLKVDAHPAVTIDAYSGMKRLVFHLARRHKCRRIAFIGGPREHSSAEHRFKAYRDALEECGINYDDRLASLDNPWTEGRKAICELLDARGLVAGRDFDALCGASDLLIFEAAKLLRERGVRIPSDIALGGFNDSDESHLFSPTYTTVHMPFDRQALQAFHMLLDLMGGRQPVDCLLKTRLIIRQSCGCLPESVEKAGAAISAKGATAGLFGFPAPEDLAAIMAASISPAQARDPGRFIPAASAFLACLRGASGKPFLDALDLLLGDNIFQSQDLDLFQDMLSDMRSACAGQDEPAARDRIESIISQARVLVSDAEKRTSNYRAWREKTLGQWLSIFNHELLCAKNFPSIVEIASRHLPRLGIFSGYFVLNGKIKATRSFIGGFAAESESPEEPRLIRPRGGKLAFPADQLLPDEYRPRCPGAFVVLPLYYESTSLGYCVLSVNDVEGSVFEEIRTQVSGAMRGVLLFEQVNEARKLAERAEKLKTSFLAGVSEELQQPLAAILALSSRLLEEPALQGRPEIEAIAAHSSRQLELTKRLMDLSLAQVDELALEKRLFNSANFLRDMVADFASRKTKAAWGTIQLGSRPGLLPLLLGDPARITQIFEIFLDYFFHELDASEVEISLRPDLDGIHIVAASETSGAAQASGGRSSAGVVGSTREMTDIEIDLARKIAFMQGGQVSLVERRGKAEFVLTLPYPTLDEMPRLDAGADSLRDGVAAGSGQLVLSGSAATIACLSGLFPEVPLCRASLSVLAGRDFNPETLAFIFLDPSALSPAEAVLLSHLLDDERYRKVSWFIAVPDECTSAGTGTTAGLAEYLRSLLPGRTSTEVLILGENGVRLKSPASAATIHCHSVEEFGLVIQKTRPALILLASQDCALLDTVAARPELAEIPLVCASSQFSDSRFEAKAVGRPLTLLFNLGETFDAALDARIAGILSGEELLPAATSATITKTIFFLNRHFREPVSRWKLSESLAVSEDYLSRIFRHQTGMPLWEYLNRLRIGYAIGLLRATGESVSEIASDSGFQDQAYFCRVFHRIAGSTPGSIRKSFTSNVRKVQEPD
ncbi:MAG: substrate-binding domain-containing protein [Spirochaetaceae bacterium]|nr:substrate-binding domain-containing protein [Spirochaetaceae bacterium]